MPGSARRRRRRTEPQPATGQGVRARGDGLRLDCRRKPGRRHLCRHDAVQVLLERQNVDRAQPSVHDVDEQLPPVRAPERQRRSVSRRERERGSERLGRPTVDGKLQRAREGRLAGRKRVLEPVAVVHSHRLAGGDRQLLLPVRQQDADRGRRRQTSRGARVVRREDLVGREALQRVALGAPLSHADAVSVAVAADEEQGSRAGGRDVLLDGGRARRVRRRHERDGDSDGRESGESPSHAETLHEGSFQSVRTASILRTTFARRRSLGCHKSLDDIGGGRGFSHSEGSQEGE